MINVFIDFKKCENVQYLIKNFFHIPLIRKPKVQSLSQNKVIIITPVHKIRWRFGFSTRMGCVTHADIIVTEIKIPNNDLSNFNSFVD